MERETLVVVNEDHTLLPEQREILQNRFGTSWKTVAVPRRGWTIKEQKKFAQSLKGERVVFVSPIPFLLKRLAHSAACWAWGHELSGPADSVYCEECLVFTNDHREAKELPDGRIIHVIAKTGWELV